MKMRSSIKPVLLLGIILLAFAGFTMAQLRGDTIPVRQLDINAVDTVYVGIKNHFRTDGSTAIGKYSRDSAGVFFENELLVVRPYYKGRVTVFLESKEFGKRFVKHFYAIPLPDPRKKK